MIGRGKYEFVRRQHAYFGIRRQISLFGQNVYAYVYVDQYEGDALDVFFGGPT